MLGARRAVMGVGEVDGLCSLTGWVQVLFLLTLFSFSFFADTACCQAAARARVLQRPKAAAARRNDRTGRCVADRWTPGKEAPGERQHLLEQ